MPWLNIVSTNFFIFIWIVSILEHPILSVVRTTSYYVEEPLEDDKFIEKYGNDNETSGRWSAVAQIQNETEELKRITTEAHKLFFTGTPKFVTIGFYTKELNFPNSPQYQPMKVDVIVYTCELRFEAPSTLYKFHLTKGLNETCIYYLVPLDPEKTKVQLQEHVCGLKYKFKT